MAETDAEVRSREVRRGWIAGLFSAIARGLKWLAFSLLFSIALEWAGMIFWWPDEGVSHSRDMLAAELRYLEHDVGRTLLSAEPAALAAAVAARIYETVVERTGIRDRTARVAGMMPENSGLLEGARGAVRRVAPFAVAALQISQVFAVRLTVLALAMPVFAMFAVVALVDGLVQRDLRRWGGGRESSFLYHWAKRSALPLLVTAWVVYLALPVSVHPVWVVLPFSALFGLCVAVAVGRFKKYL